MDFRGTKIMGSDYENNYENSLKDPESFWAEAAQAIEWDKRWEAVLDDSNPPFYRWFKGGALNTCYNALDRHIEAGNGGQNALILALNALRFFCIVRHIQLRGPPFCVALVEICLPSTTSSSKQHKE